MVKKKKTNRHRSPLHCTAINTQTTYLISRDLCSMSETSVIPFLTEVEKVKPIPLWYGALAGGVPNMPGTRILNSYTHTYTINVAIKFTCKDTKLQAVQLCPELCQTRTLQITYTSPGLSLLQKTHVLTSSPGTEMGRLW